MATDRLADSEARLLDAHKQTEQIHLRAAEVHERAAALYWRTGDHSSERAEVAAAERARQDAKAQRRLQSR